jgi:hypothetical protein
MTFLVFNLEANNGLLGYIYEFIGTFNVLILRGDKMYLQALNDGFVVLEPGVEFVYVGKTSVAMVV